MSYSLYFRMQWLLPGADMAVYIPHLRTGFDKKVIFALLLVCTGLCTTVALGSAIYLLGGLPDGLGFLPPLKR